MDVVPSPGLMNMYASSPNMSIYDQESSERWGNCSSVSKNVVKDNFMSHDTYQLDDKLEDSTLQNLLTPEVMTTLASSASAISSEFQWGGKPENLQVVNDCDGSNPTLAELNMESDLSMVQDLLNLDSAENTTIELLCNAISTKNSILTPSGTIESSQPFSCLTTSTQENIQKIMSSASHCIQRKQEDSSVRNFSTFTNNFPPRASQPPLVGVVNPTLVKKELDQTVSENFKSSSDHDSLHVKSPCLHNLLKRSPSVKSSHSDVFTARHELPAQIVPPSSGTAKRDFEGFIKAEPSSPHRRGSLRSEESIEEKWKDIESFIHKPEEPLMKKRRRYDSGGSGHTSDDYDDDMIYGDNNADDSDDDFSDIDDDITRFKPSECESLINTGKKQKQFFWQYNVQAKGPKGTRLKLSIESPSDPHVLNDFEDPVFDEGNTSVAGIRHGGKARKGDGNEISPNPKKLFMIGHQLVRLNEQINGCQMGPDVPTPQRNEAKKEKNKLASRACRLKKKAQHEANKIKLYGLEQEHCQLNDVISYIWPMLREKARAQMGHQSPLHQSPLHQSPLHQSSASESLSQKLDSFSSQKLNGKIAGNTVDFVNNVILSVEKGTPSGGLDIRKRHKT